MDRRKMVTALALIALSVGLLVWNIEDKPKQFFRNEGHVFGTVYHIQYEYDRDLHDTILLCLNEVDSALSMFNPASTISRINRNEDVTTDSDFEKVFQQAQEVSELSGGAFDLTVAPLVNAWGFGFDNESERTPEKIDSLLQTIGWQNVQLSNHRIVKSMSGIQLDASAIAKGYACDKVADRLCRLGVENLLVEIGGEVVAEGKNSQGKPWSIGITKPVDDTSGQQQELQDKLQSTHLCLATSGNYRNFYYEGAQKRSHTIDPRTGYPVRHSLLSATVTASSCMRADALATACMVLGDSAALQLIESIPDAACYLITAQEDSLVVLTSSNWTPIR
ncbi:MAG: FAD:protein FMN transferase [Paludibacteraceae bacterium]|nr:FAD:protein FMN transferase [Paludibacteraceae bacterium]